MNSTKLEILKNLFTSSLNKVAIVDAQLKVLWSTCIDLPEALDAYDFSGVVDDDEKCTAKISIKNETVLRYETTQMSCSVNVLPIFEDDKRETIEGYVITFLNFFEDIEKNIETPFSIVFKKFLRTLRNAANSIVFNTELVDQRLEDLEEYELLKKNSCINEALNKALSSCANFEEAFNYGSKDFNIMLANASEFVTDLMHFVEHAARKIGVKVNYRIENDIYLKLDYSRFIIAIMNLISNGIKYNLSEQKMIFVEFYKKDKYARFIVTDNGMGISNEKAYKIFEPFSNVNNSGMRESLGLSIVKKFADSFGGGISYKTDISGTSFMIKLPYVEKFDVNEVNIPNTDCYSSTYSPIDIYMLKACCDEDLD